MNIRVNDKSLYKLTLKNIGFIMYNNKLSDEEKLQAIPEVITKFNKLREIFDEKHRNEGLNDVERMMNILEHSRKSRITYDQCYAIFFEDNTFTIAHKYVRGESCGIHRERQIILEDLVSGSMLDIHSQDSLESYKKPYPIWDTREDGVISKALCGACGVFYFIELDELFYFDEGRFGVKTYINPDLLNEIIAVANAYLDENPLFVEQTVLKRVKKKIGF